MNVTLQQVAPADIEARSMEIITQELGDRRFPPEQLPIIRRVIHTTADFDYADNLVFSPGAVKAGIAALRKGCTIVTDTRMAWSGVSKELLKERFGGGAVCFMGDAGVAEEAKKRGITRAAVSMERAAALEGPLVLALGNAPTALIRACQLMEEGRLAPALVIGAPVGFVNAAESKELLLGMDVPHIAARGRKGGSGVAAAICNALIRMALEEDR
ncbi:MAG: precorrin-8X methylmutase [Oscillospiraceae bacterium]|nr:precorrin-8X methylmutase [Oscillospiraceae bacterium]